MMPRAFETGSNGAIMASFLRKEKAIHPNFRILPHENNALLNDGACYCSARGLWLSAASHAFRNPAKSATPGLVLTGSPQG
jgi:hypothetical protein